MVTNVHTAPWQNEKAPRQSRSFFVLIWLNDHRIILLLIEVP